jgi:hypothetical protein
MPYIDIDDISCEELTDIKNRCLEQVTAQIKGGTVTDAKTIIEIAKVYEEYYFGSPEEDE